jgi:hypothetical protein
MHNCEYTSGAWFRSTNTAEEHAFYDPGVGQFYRNTGTTSTLKLISVANSKRGHYFAVFWDSSVGKSWLSYSYPSSFWTQVSSGAYEWGGIFDHKFIRLDISTASDRIFYIGLSKAASVTGGNGYFQDIFTLPDTYAKFVQNG